MKKFIMTFLVAGLIITSALSLSSCNKKDTNSNANTEEWVPIVYEVVDPEVSYLSGDGSLITDEAVCPYCHLVMDQCTHTIGWVNEAFYCPEHSHVHCFEATDDCSSSELICEYKGIRKHYHIITAHGWYWHGSHVGGGVCP